MEVFLGGEASQIYYPAITQGKFSVPNLSSLIYGKRNELIPNTSISETQIYKLTTKKLLICM
jgi:hypothetical protein